MRPPTLLLVTGLPPPVTGTFHFWLQHHSRVDLQLCQEHRCPISPVFSGGASSGGCSLAYLGPWGCSSPKLCHEHKRDRMVPDVITHFPQRHPVPSPPSSKKAPLGPMAPAEHRPQVVLTRPAHFPVRPNPTVQAAAPGEGCKLRNVLKTYSEWHARSVPALPIVSGKQKCLSKYQLEPELAASGGIKEPCWQAQD